MLLVHLLIYPGVPLRGRRQRGASILKFPNVSGCFCNSGQKFQSGGVTALNRSLWLIIMVATAGQGEEKHGVQQESRLAWSSAV